MPVCFLDNQTPLICVGFVPLFSDPGYCLSYPWLSLLPFSRSNLFSLLRTHKSFFLSWGCYTCYLPDLEHSPTLQMANSLGLICKLFYFQTSSLPASLPHFLFPNPLFPLYHLSKFKWFSLSIYFFYNCLLTTGTVASQLAHYLAHYRLSVSY